MQGSVSPLTQFIQGGSGFIIPVYQRNYDWKITNCKQLFDDLIQVAKENRRQHFFGSVVTKPGDGYGESIIIDGQQRLTTSSLLLLAMSRHLEEVEASGTLTSEKLKSYFLLNDFKPSGENYKLVPIKRDFEAYKQLFSPNGEVIPASNITINYQYFYDRIQKEEISIDELFQSVQKLEIMVINLNSPDDDPQLIFESLNSTGLDLTDADKVRNFLLMGETQENQQHYFQYFWEPIERKTNFDVSDFIRQYLTIKLKRIPSISKVYFEFKEYVTKSEIDKERLFKELYDYAEFYQQMKECNTTSLEANKILFRLNYLEISVLTPYLMRVLKRFSDDELSVKELVSILSVVEVFVARRLITKIPTAGLNMIMATLDRDIEKYSKLDNDYVEVLKYVLISKQASGRLPSNEEVEEAIRTQNFYGIKSNVRTYLFERLENKDSQENIDVYNGIETGTFSIEHIMPQTLSNGWKEYLGSQSEEIHETWLNRISNLTLTAYNSKYSNRSFEEKKNMEKGFKDSGFRLNQYVNTLDCWNESSLKERTKVIENEVLKIWPYPETFFVPQSPDNQLIPFDSSENYTGLSLKAYEFLDSGRISEKLWKNMYLAVIEKLFKSDPSIIFDLVLSDAKSGLAAQFYASDTIDESSKIAEGVYCYSGLSNYRKMFYLKQLLDLYKIDESQLSFETVKNEKK
ncbi:DUF262 domain-containing protein [Enterococcus plantarum]|uniref:DUF262 domain-containing protein n=1 Tax=Enterococcus plantarum TaxID=1077675 RepID=A0A2W3Z2R1_9ENTE|nr:DUF262 domain-containing protein [Enterococcus plantarum]PZL74241.1 DUF262 domain-containing protein [Enterococcus plantarum]